MQEGLRGAKPQICNAKTKAEMRTRLPAWSPKETKPLKKHGISVISAIPPNSRIRGSVLTLLHRGEEVAKI